MMLAGAYASPVSLFSVLPEKRENPPEGPLAALRLTLAGRARSSSEETPPLHFRLTPKIPLKLRFFISGPRAALRAVGLRNAPAGAVLSPPDPLTRKGYTAALSGKAAKGCAVAGLRRGP